MRTSILNASIFLSLLLLLAGCKQSPTRKVQDLLAEAKLSGLPPSATNVSYYRWSSSFAGETYAKFELSLPDLRTFVSNSPGLQGIKPKLYDSNHHHVPSPSSTFEVSVDHDYFDRHSQFPDWFDMTIRGHGRKYIIPWGPSMWVLIDEDKRIVWLRLIKG
jgi:hypothetical protein